jgi:hypothetical protein
MKTQLFAAALLAVIAAPLTYAQNSALGFEVPFPFYAGEKAMPAGSYRVATVWGAIEIRGAKGPGAFIASQKVEARQRPANASLVFHQYGNSYFLSQFIPGLDNREWQVSPGSREREMANSGRNAAQTAVIATR